MKKTLVSLLSLAAVCILVVMLAGVRRANRLAQHLSVAPRPGATILAASNSPGLAHVWATNAALVKETAATVPKRAAVISNPYAGALRVPGKSKRAWDAGFLGTAPRTEGSVISFELTEGQKATGTVKLAQLTGGDLTYISGELTAPERGRFFFLKPPDGGKAGTAVGVIEFPASRKAFRIEPTGAGGRAGVVGATVGRSSVPEYAAGPRRRGDQ